MSDSNEAVTFLTKKLWRFSKGNRHNVILYIVLFLIANIIGLLQPLIIAKILNTIQEHGVNKDNLWFLLGAISLFFFLNLGFWLFHAPARVIERKNAFIAKHNYKKYLIKGVFRLAPDWHSQHHSGDTIDKIEKGTNALFNYAGSSFEVIEVFVRLFGSLIVLFYFDLSAGFITIFGVIIAVSLILQFDKRMLAQYRELNKHENSVSQKVFDTISNITTIIILRVENLASKTLFKSFYTSYKTYKKNIILNEVKWGASSLFATLIIVIVLGLYLFRHVLSGETILIGTVYLLYGYVDRVTGLFYRFAGRYSEFVRNKTAIENAEELSNEFKKNTPVKQIPIGKRWKHINIENLTFSYHGKENEDLHLNNIALQIKRKEKIALIGESGSGKTTFLKLLRGLYPARKITVHVDDQEIPSLESINSKITLLPQEPELFATTIKENITMGMPYTQPTIEHYADLACFSSVAKKLPNGYDSIVGEKGVNMSGGEKQRLALTRGLLAAKKKQIILLDEPTSSVDSRNELAIYENIFNEFRNKTIISTIHRLHLLHMFDTIYLFEKGKIVASGSLQELLRNSPEFKKLWKKYHQTKKEDYSNNASFSST